MKSEKLKKHFILYLYRNIKTKIAFGFFSVAVALLIPELWEIIFMIFDLSSEDIDLAYFQIVIYIVVALFVLTGAILLASAIRDYNKQFYLKVELSSNRSYLRWKNKNEFPYIHFFSISFIFHTGQNTATITKITCQRKVKSELCPVIRPEIKIEIGEKVKDKLNDIERIDNILLAPTKIDKDEKKLLKKSKKNLLKEVQPITKFELLDNKVLSPNIHLDNDSSASFVYSAEGRSPKKSWHSEHLSNAFYEFKIDYRLGYKEDLFEKNIQIEEKKGEIRIVKASSQQRFL